MNDIEILEHVRGNGGITLTPEMEIQQDIKFVSALFGHEVKVAVQALDNFDLKTTLKYYRKLAKKFNASVGLWIDEGLLYIDIGKNFESEEECRNFAVSNRQKAYFDAIRGQSVYLTEPQ